MIHMRPVFAGYGAAALALTLSACAAGAPPPPATLSPGTPPLSAPAPIPGYDWFLMDDDDSEISLAYGLAESDDVPLSLSCRRGAGEIELMQDAGLDAPPEIHLESGGETERFAAVGLPSELTGGVLMTGMADVDEPVLQRFRRTGWLAVWAEGLRKPYAAHPGSETRVSRFFDLCARR